MILNLIIKNIDIIIKNRLFSNILIIILIVYITLIKHIHVRYLINLSNNRLLNMLYCAIILYISFSNVRLSLFLIIAYSITYNYLLKHNINKLINQVIYKDNSNKLNTKKQIINSNPNINPLIINPNPNINPLIINPNPNPNPNLNPNLNINLNPIINPSNINPISNINPNLNTEFKQQYVNTQLNSTSNLNLDFKEQNLNKNIEYIKESSSDNKLIKEYNASNNFSFI